MSQNMLDQDIPNTPDRFEQLAAMMEEGALVINASGQILFSNSAAKERYHLQATDHVHLPDGNRQNGQILHAGGWMENLPANTRVQLVSWQGQPAFLLLFHEPRDEQRNDLSEDRNRAVMEIQIDPIFRYRPNLVISYANIAACHFFGKKRQDLVGASLLSLVPKRNQERTRRHVSALLSKPQMMVSEQALLASNKETRWMQLAEQPLLDGSGSITEVLVVGRDITERKLAEKALRDSETRYRALIEDSPAVICRFLPDGTLTYMNETGCDYFGQSRDSLVGKNIKDLLPLEYHPGTDRMLASFTPDMRRKTLETEIFTGDGERHWMRMTARGILDGDEHALEYQAVGIDFTESKQAEQLVRDSEQRFRELLENLHMIAVLINMDGSVHFANPYFFEMSGFLPEEILGKNWIESMVPPDERGRVVEAFERMMQSGQAIPYGENHIVTRGGDWRLIGWNTTRLSNAHGEMIGLASIGEDITEQRWSQKTQEIIHAISQGAVVVETLGDLFSLIHFNLSNLMPVDNFFISLYDQAINQLSFPYFIDQYDDTPDPGTAGRGLTEYVLRTGKPLLASPEVFDELVARGEVESMGAPSVDWLGVPLKTATQIIGVMVVQSYTEGVRFKQHDLQILDFVSTQVAATIERKWAEQALRENEEKYRALVEASSSAIFLETYTGQILDVNSAASKMLGYSKEELVNMQVSQLVPETRLVEMETATQALERKGGHRWETVNKAKDGRLVPVEVNTRRIVIGGQKLVVVYVDDITERRQRERELETIAAVSAALRTVVTQAEILPVIFEQLVSRLNVYGAIITLNEPDNGMTKIELGCGTWASLSGWMLPERETLCQRVACSGKLYLNNQADGDSLFPFPEMIDGVRAIASVPLIMQGHSLGALTVGYERSIRSEEVHILNAISDIAASAIQRARLYEQTSRQAKELAEAYDATIEGWALALELRNKETEGHSRRVTDMTLRLAKRVGITDAELVHIRRGVLLHDIGKMGIPDSILLKPGPLSDEEWVTMRLHPEHAYHMLSSISYLRPALDIPYCHHEKWDGTGYPRHLKGEAIPLYARIFSVVDVMDAITSPRPYRTSCWSNAEALAYIQKQAGQHFDPHIVEAFLGMTAAGD